MREAEHGVIVYRNMDREALYAAYNNSAAVADSDGYIADWLRRLDLAQYIEAFAENAILVVDDSHGVGALGQTGRGTEEITRPGAADLLVATLGKALGVNGGYVAGCDAVIRFLRETSPFYVYSNPITPAEAAAALAAIEAIDGAEGAALLGHLRGVTDRFRRGLKRSVTPRK